MSLFSRPVRFEAIISYKKCQYPEPFLNNCWVRQYNFIKIRRSTNKKFRCRKIALICGIFVVAVVVCSFVACCVFFLNLSIHLTDMKTLYFTVNIINIASALDGTRKQIIYRNFHKIRIVWAFTYWLINLVAAAKLFQSENCLVSIYHANENVFTKAADFEYTQPKFNWFTYKYKMSSAMEIAWCSLTTRANTWKSKITHEIHASKWLFGLNSVNVRSNEFFSRLWFKQMKFS